MDKHKSNKENKWNESLGHCQSSVLKASISADQRYIL